MTWPVEQLIDATDLDDPLVRTATFDAFKAAGYDVVINLAMPDSTNALPNEAELVCEQGLEYVHIPVVWEDPTYDDLDQFFRVMTQYQDRKVLVHCALNWRVSSFVFLYRVIQQRVSVEVAEQSLLKIWQPDLVWQGFIERSLARYRVSS